MIQTCEKYHIITPTRRFFIWEVSSELTRPWKQLKTAERAERSEACNNYNINTIKNKICYICQSHLPYLSTQYTPIQQCNLYHYFSSRSKPKQIFKLSKKNDDTCQYCDKIPCRNCQLTCDGCWKKYCLFCCRVSYEYKHEKVICGLCEGNSNNNDMDWE